MTTFSNPYRVDPALDRLQTPAPGVANWSENINLAVHSGHDDTGVYTHLSRMIDDPDLWEGTIAVYLPGGALLVNRSFGRAASAEQASSGNLTWSVHEPPRKWSMHFDGMARPITRAAATAGFVGDGPTELLSMDLHITAAGPVWSLEHALGVPGARQSFASLHLQQAVHVQGAVRTRRHNVDIDHVAVRDHSAGARDYAGLLGDHWTTCPLPDGRVLSALNLWQTVGAPSISTGFLVDGDTLHPVGNITVERLASPGGDPERLGMDFDGPDGRTHIDISLQHSMVFTLTEPIGMPLGTDHTGLITVQGPARYRLNGQETLGWLERCGRLAPR
ncbi:MAG TPA: hypothetical protein VGH89_38935 [Pseudonocardia sp.]